MERILLLFADGVGLAPAGPSNPLAATPTPALTGLLGTPLTAEAAGGAARDGAAVSGAAEDGAAVLFAVDATLGVEGLPQSATGQTTLFTGVNAAAHMGRHVSAFPGPRLKHLIEEHGLLRRARRLGLEVTFANPFSAAFFERLAARRGRCSATTVTALSAGLRLRDEDDLRLGDAVAWDVTRELFGRRSGGGFAAVSPRQAGRHLAAIAGHHHLTLWETFLTDLAGHGRFGLTGAAAVERLDGLLAGLLEARPPELTVLLTSDHGNLEDATHTLHTRNPVPLLAVGPLARHFTGLTSLTEVTPAILAALAGEAGAAPGRDAAPGLPD